MPKFLEKKLKKQYPGNPSAVYGTMNKMGFMHGNKETAKGKAAEKKHMKDMKMSPMMKTGGSSKSSITGQKEKVSSGKKIMMKGKKKSKRQAFVKNLMNAARY
jgi:hypothetical protein